MPAALIYAAHVRASPTGHAHLGNSALNLQAVFS